MPSMIDSRPIEILHIEDNPGDVDLVKATFRASDKPINLTWARNGVEGLSLLEQSQSRLPNIVLLDWNLPRKSGAEVLRELKISPRFRRIPVVVLTSSASPEDIALAYDLGANCYLCKSIDLIETKRVLQALENFWFTSVQYAR